MKWLDQPPFESPHDWGVTWGDSRRSVLVVDRVLYDPRRVRSRISGRFAYLVGIREGDLDRLADHLDVEWLRIFDVRASDLSPLARIGRLRHLMVDSSTKLHHLRDVGALTELRTLVLHDVRPGEDLAPLADLARLRALEITRGFVTPIRVRSLEPLAGLADLEEADFHLDAVREGGLRPLARCRSLRRLGLNARSETAEYAYLRAKRPEIECAMLAPWIPITLDDDDRDRLVTGKRKPVLHSVRDAARLARYEAEFERLRAGFAAAPDPQGSNE